MSTLYNHNSYQHANLPNNNNNSNAINNNNNNNINIHQHHRTNDQDVLYQFQVDEQQKRQRRLWLTGSLVIVLFLSICVLVLPAIPQRHANKNKLATTTTTNNNKNNSTTNSNNDNYYYYNGSNIERQKELLNHPLKLQELTKKKNAAATPSTNASTTSSSPPPPSPVSPVALHSGCEATVLLIRHCEKGGPLTTDSHGNQHCSYLGWERNYFLTTLFGNDPATARWPAPVVLYALAPKRDDDAGSHYYYNFREWETLMPLSSQLGLPVHAQYNNGLDVALDIFAHLQSGTMCGKLMLVAWKHSLFVELATALACGPDDGCPTYYPEESFDQVWQIKYVYNAKAIGTDPGTTTSVVDNNNKTTTTTTTTAPSSATIATTDTSTDNNDNTTLERAMDASFNETLPPPPRGRRLHHHHHHHHRHHHQSSQDDKHDPLAPLQNRKLERGDWSIYATVGYQNFDPLQYSHKVGDYPVGGIAVGGNWATTISSTTSSTTSSSSVKSGGEEM